MAAVFGYGFSNDTGETVTERSALGISAFFRGVSVISNTIAALPLKTYRDPTTPTTGQATPAARERVTSWCDNPAGPESQTPFEWTETAVLHIILGGDVFGVYRFNGAGAIAGTTLVHPLAVQVEWDEEYVGGKRYTVTYENGSTEDMGADRLLHIPGPSVDGLRGMSVLSLARRSLGITQAGEKAAGRMFATGMAHQVLVTPEDDLEPGEASKISSDLNARLGGASNNGKISVVNRRLKLTPWSMSSEDAQFLQSREFQISEVARWLGVPATLLMKDGAVSTWGTGVEIMNLGLHRYTLLPWTTRFEQRMSRTLPSPRFVEFDYSGFLKPSPADEINLLISQVNAGFLTLNEARAVRNLPPLDDPSANLPRLPAGAAPPGAPTPAAPAPTPRETP